MNTEKMMQQTSNPALSGAQKRERLFQLSLPASVSGLDASDRIFEENTNLKAISSQHATFRLEARVLIGSCLHLSLKIPRTLILENPLFLNISGRVILVRTEAEGNSQLITLLLKRAFNIQKTS
ncbi:MAG: hypothetical protein KJ768_05035 [Acidobacteria bacterium]|nr:hypothetical protein [Acidobacteriota bacterium]